MSERKKIESFEDIEAWKEARVQVSMVYESTGKEPFKKSQLYTSLDLHYLDSDIFKLLMERSTKVAKLLQGFIRYLKTTNKPSTSMRGCA